jgi:hypothetical protein
MSAAVFDWRGVREIAGIRTIKASIPFSFTAGNKTMPAGDYTLKRGASNQPGILLIKSVDDQSSVFLLTEGDSKLSAPRKTELIFNKIDDQYFLSKITVAYDNEETMIPEPKSERALEHTLARNDVPHDRMISMVTIEAQK